MFIPENEIKMKSLGVKSLAKSIRVKSVQLLGGKEKIEWEQTDEALLIDINNIENRNDAIWVFKIKVK
jgi:hypothetical protein